MSLRTCLTWLIAVHLGVILHAQEPPAGSSAQASSQEWLRRGELTGDWGGAREKLKSEGGTTLEIAFTQFFHWVPEGDDDRGFDYGGKLDVKSKTSLGKWLKNTSFVDAHVEMRYGDTPLFGGGTLIPTTRR